MQRSSVLFILASAAFGQHLSVGVIGGAPVTNLVTGETGTRYTVGPTVQLLLPLGFAVEADALYRGFDIRAPISLFPNVTSLQISGSQWRFPILLQYRIHTPLLKPFLEAGVSFDHLSGLKQAVVTASRNSGDLLQTTHAGAVIGAGLDLKIPFVRITPGFRYTRQGSSDFRDISNLDQFEFLVGIRF